jgi:hypothetical protein
MAPRPMKPTRGFSEPVIGVLPGAIARDLSFFLQHFHRDLRAVEAGRVGAAALTAMPIVRLSVNPSISGLPKGVDVAPAPLMFLLTGNADDNARIMRDEDHRAVEFALKRRKPMSYSGLHGPSSSAVVGPSAMISRSHRNTLWSRHQRASRHRLPHYYKPPRLRRTVSSPRRRR